MELRDKLKDLRMNSKSSCADIAKIIGVPESTYRGYEYGSRLPAFLVPQLCSAFSITYEEFFHSRSTSSNIKKNKIIDSIEGLLKELKQVTV